MCVPPCVRILATRGIYTAIYLNTRIHDFTQLYFVRKSLVSPPHTRGQFLNQGLSQKHTLA